MVFGGKVRSRKIVAKLLALAKCDIQHNEAVKALQKAKVLSFYEPVRSIS